MTFEELEVGDKFVSAVGGEVAQAYQKKSKTSAYALYGGDNGELVNAVKSDTRTFGKKDLVIKIEA